MLECYDLRVDETANSSIIKNSILLSRNKPVALVVGAAGFLGSHLVDKLLSKNIQVIGVDNLQTGKKENLQVAIEDKNFHLLIEDAQDLELNLDRLDYLFIVAIGDWNLEKILKLFKETKCRCLLASSIDLYEKDNDSPRLRQLKSMESKLAKFASEHNLNARVVRLGSVYGSRMDFDTREPLVRLIQQALTGGLQKDVSLEFSSRALYVSDAVDLLVRTIFSGSTSQKIFDGVNPDPVKVAEIKQVLLDPVWYENRDFYFSKLPPWPTPNLEKTIKFLNWYPKSNLVTDLKNTLSYFKDNEIQVPKVIEEKTEVREKEQEWSEQKKADLEAFKKQDKSLPKSKKGTGKSKFSLPLSKIYLLIIVALITYAIIWPGLVLGWGAFTFQTQISEGLKNLQKGNFEGSLENIRQANIGASEVKSILDSLEPIRKFGLLNTELEMGQQLVKVSSLTGQSAASTIGGVQLLLTGLKAVTGESTDSPASYFSQAQIELSSASENFAKADTILSDPEFKKNVPGFLLPRIKSLADKLTAYSRLISKAQALSVLLPNLVALDGSKDYLILLQNNMELRPGGGFIGSFAKVSFEGGKLKNLAVNDIYAIDGQLNIHVEPPKEIKDDLGQKDWFLRDSNWEPDFPTSARQAEWFYTKETGEKVEGVIALDVSAMEKLLSVLGPLDLPDYKETITSDNLFEKAISHAELSFFPGSQAKKSFLTAITNGVFNKIFFLPQNNWPAIISELSRSLEEKHISIYLNDPKLFSYLDSQGWTHPLPREDKGNENQDFLSLVEANLGADKVNYYLDRSYNLETQVGKDGEIQHTLRISYTNRSPSNVFPGGKYKNRMRVYLPMGSKLSKALWGESDITNNVTSFVDYGRSGYSLLLELAPKEQKTLVLDYTVPVKLKFNNGQAAYRLDIIKQQGTLKDPFTWTISYPISYNLVSDQTKKLGPQEQTIQTDLSVDRSFQVEFKK